MIIFKLIAGPLIGALIGYFTNYIAVKMLFKPLHPVYIGKWRLPFTPGIIPKRKDELARALGKAVGQILLTKKDLGEVLTSAHMRESIAQAVFQELEVAVENPKPIRQLAQSYLSEEQYGRIKDKLEKVMTEKIVHGLDKMDVGEIIAQEGSAAIKEKVQGTMMAMMLNDKVINSFAGPVGERAQDYIREHGAEKIGPVIAEELVELENRSMKDLLGQFPMDKDKVSQLIEDLYDKCIENKLEVMLEKIDIAAIVTEKVQAMDVRVLEDLLLSVMKHELNAVVNLGAIIGLLIGLLNLLIAAI